MFLCTDWRVRQLCEGRAMKLRQQWLSVLLLIIMMLFKLCSILTLYSVHAASAELMEVEHEHADDRMPITSKKPRKDPCR